MPTENCWKSLNFAEKFEKNSRETGKRRVWGKKKTKSNAECREKGNGRAPYLNYEPRHWSTLEAKQPELSGSMRRLSSKHAEEVGAFRKSGSRLRTKN